jgi:hypothetical protein
MKLQLALGLLALSATSMAAVKIQEELYIPGNNPSVVKALVQTGSVEIDHVTSQGFEVYGSKGLAAYLDSHNIPYVDMKEMNNKMLADYPSSAQVAEKIKALVAKYPKIMKLVNIGKSVKGKDLLFVKISDNVETDEVEPEFKYISSMHGDEITGRELTTMLIEEIGKKYGSDSEITELVNNSELYIMPSMNPDGSDMKQRANAKYSDLNRNFPDIISDSSSSASGREIETQAVMAFQASSLYQRTSMAEQLLQTTLGIRSMTFTRWINLCRNFLLVTLKETRKCTLHQNSITESQTVLHGTSFVVGCKTGHMYGLTIFRSRLNFLT